MHKESALQLGKAQHISAVVTEPADGGSDTALVIVNAGLVHRVGPFRFHVRLLRQLASTGLVGVRVDLPGIGYSTLPASQDGDGLLETADAVISHLRASHGIEKFIFAGLCSGAENTHRIVLQRPEVIGAVFLDGFAYQNWKSRLQHYRLRLFKLGVWRDWWQARSRRREQARNGGDSAGPEAGIWEVNIPARDSFQRDIARMTDRGARLLFVYAGRMGYYNYQNQFFDTVPGVNRDLVDVHIIDDADHTYILPADRAGMLETVTGWVTRHFAGDHVASRAG